MISVKSQLSKQQVHSSITPLAELFGQKQLYILTAVGSKVHIKHSMLHLRGMRGRLKVLSTVAASAVVLRQGGRCVLFFQSSFSRRYISHQNTLTHVVQCCLD